MFARCLFTVYAGNKMVMYLQSQSASRPNVRGAKSDAASIKLHHQPVKNKDHVTRPEEACMKAS